MILGNTYSDGSVKWKVKTNSMGGGYDILYSTSPVGSILPYTVSNDLPNGYLICNGAAVLREDYPDLFARIGTVYGAGDGSTTFNLPDLRDRFIQGGETAGTVKDAGLPNITGYASIDDTQSNKGNWYATGALKARTMAEGQTVQGSTTYKTVYRSLGFDASLSSSIYGNSTTVQPPALVMVYIIKAFQTIEYSAINPPVLNKKEVITTSGTYTCPVTGWYKLTIKGAGGSGGTGVNGTYGWSSGGGGGEGGSTIIYTYLNKNDSFSYVLGAGGNNSSGGNSTLNLNGNTYTAGGGSYGSSLVSGSGGTGTIKGHHGNEGISVTSTGVWANSGYGGGRYGGESKVNDIGSNGYYGCGGSGGSSYGLLNDSGKHGYNGGKGGDGVLYIEYFDDSINT